jgi:RND superfamily putative drug exporter
VLIWLLLLLGGGYLATFVLDSVLTTEAAPLNAPEAKRADTLLEEKMLGPRRDNEIVIVTSSTLTVDDPQFRDQVNAVTAQLAGLEGGVVAFAGNYYITQDATLVSKDRRATIIAVVMSGSMEGAIDNVGRVREVVTRADGQDGFNVYLTGAATLSSDFSAIAEEDLRAAETFGVAIGVIILVLVFGAVAAAFLPVALAGLSIVVALGLTALVGSAFSLSFFVTNMITMMGLAVGIDYALFIVERFREERRNGLPKHEAIARSADTAGRAVLFSGMTVVLALFGMVLVPTTVFRSLGVGAILVVICSVLASMTLLPAALAILGDRVNWVRVPYFGRRQGANVAGEQRGFWVTTARVVMAHPWPALALTTALLIAPAVFYAQIHTGAAGVSSLPDSMASKRGYEVLQREFGYGLGSPVEIVVSGNVNDPSVLAAVDRLKARLAGDPAFGPPGGLQVNAAGDLGLLSVPGVGDPNSIASVDAVERLRRQYVPEAFGGVQAEVLVGGVSAFNADFFALADRYIPVVFAFVLGLSFLLLMVVFRSVVVPIKAILMNLLAVGASYGMLVLVFQKGFATSLLGFQRAETIEAWIPLFLFAVLFGLSMDYHVFLLSRIREHYDRYGDNATAVAFGLRSTGRLITGAALIMVAVFAGFASGQMVMFQQVGFGLAVAVFLDATVIRSILVPASMRLLGRVNWYLPPVLRWLPDLRVETTGATTPAGSKGELAVR